MFRPSQTGEAVARVRVMRVRRRFLWLPLVAVLALVPVPASAVTVDQVVALAHAGVTDAVILALIDRDRTIFAIEPEQIVTLQRDGLSEAVILAMLKSGREEGEQAARADSAYTAATIAAAIAPAPEFVIVGHGPDRPNTAHIDSFYSGPPAFNPYFTPYGTLSRRHSLTPSFGARRFDATRQLCFAQVSTARSGAGQTLGFVTECPAPLQRALNRSPR
jgi:hypothetical protein